MARFVLTAQLQLQAPNNVGQIVSQIQNQLNGINVNVQVQGSARAQQQIQQITQSTDQATSAADRMGRAFAVSIRRFAAFSIATRAVGLFTSTLSNAIQTSIDFERQLIKVAQVTGKNVGSLRDLTNEITNLSTGLGVSSQSLLDVTTILTQAGLTANDTKIALNSLAKAALAPNFDSITQTAEGAIAILAQFKLGVGALESQLGSINAVAGAFAVEASDLIDVIRRTGGVFKSSGGDLNELLALFTSVRATTRESAESIGTGLRTIFTRIQRPETIEFLKQFGVELVDLEGKFVGPYEAIRRLSGALSGLGERDLTFIKIAEELGGFRQIGKVLPLLQQFSTAESALSVAQKANNSLTQDAVSAQAALAVRIMKVREEFLALVRGITETPTFQIMANTALTLASALIKVADSIKPLLPLLTAVAAFRAVRGVGSFVGSAVAGLQSGRTFNQGGKVHHFAAGGLVPGVGNSDTVPAMLSPGEFVIRKSSVQSLGASNLAGMNRGGEIQRFAQGGMSTADKIASARASANFNRPKNPTKNIQDINVPLPKFAKESTIGIATTDFLGSPIKGGVSVDRDTDLVNQQIGNLSKSLSSIYGAKNALSYVQKIYKGKKTFSYGATTEGIGQNQESQFKTIINESIGSAIDIAANRFSTEVMKTSGPGSIKKLPSFYQTLDQGFRGQLFENVITGLNGRPLSGQDSRRPFDFTKGIGQFKSIYSNLPMNYVDAKISASASGVGKKGMTSDGLSTLRTKASAQLASETIPLISLLERQAGGVGTMTTAGKKAKFATGGGVGTDTVPALLTPGEFVVNKASAQRIGYSNLGRMNRVGKYANGGVVQRFAGGGTATTPASLQAFNSFFGNSSSGGGASGNPPSSQAQATQQATQATRQFGMGISMVSASMQAMLKPLDENSSAMDKFGHSMLGIITTIGGVIFALESFGVTLTKGGVMDFLSGGGNTARAANSSVRGGVRTVSNALNNANMPTLGKAVNSLARPLGNAANLLTKFAGPLAVAATGITIMNAAISAFSDASVKQKQAIEKGDVSGAGQAAGEQASLEAGNTARMAGGLGGAALGFMVGGPIGAAIGAGLGALFASAEPAMAEYISVMFGGNTTASAVALAEAQAQATKTQKAFEQGEKDATKAMEDFNRGAITAAQAFEATANVRAEAGNLREANNKAMDANEKNKSTGSVAYGVRGVASALTLGYVESQATRNARLDKESEGINKSTIDSERKAYEMSKGGRNAMMRDALVQGKSKEEISAALKDASPEALKAKQREAMDKATEAMRNGNTGQANNYAEQAKMFGDQAKETAESLENLDKEVKLAKEKFEAINLGFRSVTSASDAAALRMSNLSQSFEVGALPIQQATATLEAALTSAGQNISKADFGSALKEVQDVFTEFGASEDQIKKFTGAMEGVAGVQRNFPAIFDQMKAKIKAGGFTGMDASKAGEEFKKVVGEQLAGAKIAPEVQDQIKKAMGDVKLSAEDLDKIDKGDFSVLEKYLGDAGAEVSKVMKGVMDNYVKVHQELINVTKQRIDAERNAIEAQKEALSLQMEGRELQGKYGGKAVTNEERRQNILARANANGVGPNMKTGSLAEIRARNNAMSFEFAATEQQRRTKNGMAGVKGVEADARQQDIQKAQKDQVNTIRELVKLEEENLKLIGEKNKLEKDSIDALVTGDIDKFMESQATVGATAAIATGNSTLMNAFGANALGSAAQDIRRQQDAGVQSIYGRQLGGQGGLTQQAYGAALGARGITDPRMAQVATGNTAEEEAAKSRLRDYGTALDETGALGSQMAEMQVETAEMRVQQAQIIVDNLATGGTPAIGKANGGLIYASRGMFIPRGTDTVPAMLTPGEFVVRREAVNRGNNLQLLQQMNGTGGGMTSSSEVMGFARGGRVQYYSAGSTGPVQQQSGSSSVDGNNFINQLSKQLDRLENAVVQHSVGNSTVRVDIMGGGMLQQIAGNIEQNVRNSVSQQLSGSHATENGLTNNGSVLGA